MTERLIEFIRDWYSSDEFIPLHAPVFRGQECANINSAIESTYVSSVGSFIQQFEFDMMHYTGSLSAVATVNGTSALHTSLLLGGVTTGNLVITQGLTFVATANAIRYCGAFPIFIDVDLNTLGLSPASMNMWLEENAYLDGNFCKTKKNNTPITACVPVHTFGHPADLDGLMKICEHWKITLIEDAAESLGSFYKDKHTGTFGKYGSLSFNGNKVITTGGGGMILSGLHEGGRARHLTTTAKIPHKYDFLHDQVGYNYRMPNINAAIGCGQIKQINYFLKAKRDLANAYQDLLEGSNYQFFCEPAGCKSNYWLNTVICENSLERDELLSITNSAGIATRPVWELMNLLPMYKDCMSDNLNNSRWLRDRIVNLPSSVR
jgi:aminotransferase in exopolysaccharide biosynthesis